MLEGIVCTENLRYKHVGLFSNHTAAVSWTQREAKKSPTAAQLLIALALQQQVGIASPLVAAHVTGDLNVLVKIPYHSFGYSKQ